MRRFVLEAIFLSIAATVIWWLTDDLTAQTTIAGGRLLHRLVGYPAPGMAQGVHLYWLSPLFPPLVGLLLASRWVPWPRRLIGLGITLIAFWYMVSFQAAVTFSPYLTNSAIRAYLMKSLISLNQVAVPIVLWLIVAGVPRSSYFTSGQQPARASSKQHRTAPARNARTPPARSAGTKPPKAGIHPLLVVVFSGVLCLITTLPVILAIEQTTPELDAVRKRVANAIIAKDYARAGEAIRQLHALQGPSSNLRHLHAELKRLATNTTP
jgi:hypothetical protein